MAATSTSDLLFRAKPRRTTTIGSGGVPDGTTTTIPLASASELNDGEAYIVVINRVDANGTRQDTWEATIGVVSGTNLINCERGVEGTAQAWSAGTVVEILMTATHWNKMVEWAETEHNQDGTHKKITNLDNNVAITQKDSGGTARSVAKINSADELVFGPNFAGWYEADETWTYASATSFTVSGDVRSKYPKGTKIRLKQGGDYKYFVVTGTSYSSPNTTVSITGGDDYSLANDTITDNYFSYSDNPVGFPPYFSHTPQITSNGGDLSLGDATVAAYFMVGGRICTYGVQITFGSTSTFGGTRWKFIPPIPIFLTGKFIGATGTAIAYNGTHYPGIMRADTSGNISILRADEPFAGADDAIWGYQSPFTWSSGNVLHATFVYAI